MPSDPTQIDHDRQDQVFPVCLYCKRKGHIIAECWELEKKKTRANPVSICAKLQNPAPPVEPAKEEEKNPFISEGYVSISKGGHAVPIWILRDTGAAQSLLRRVHTNPLKCALDQIASSRFELIRSVHTLFTEDYGLPKIYCEAHNNMKVYLEIYAI